MKEIINALMQEVDKLMKEGYTRAEALQLVEIASKVRVAHCTRTDPDPKKRRYTEYRIYEE